MSAWTRVSKYFFLIAILLSLTGCSAMMAQNPGEGLSPVNAIATETEDHLMLFGADVVAYFNTNQYVQGSPEFRSKHKGVDFYFSSAANKTLFDAGPEAYIPQYGGYCANGIAFGIPWGGDADAFLIHNDKLYIFGGKQSMQAFMLDRDKNIALADKYWQEEVKDTHSFWQRTKRLILRVPHYQSGEEQAAAIKAAGK